MAKVFNKGDLVTHITNWDRRGTFIFQTAVVYSAGMKQMVLTDEPTGEEMGRNYKPVIGDDDGTGTFHRMTDAEARAHCLKLGAAWIPSFIDSHEKMIAFNKERWPESGPGYENCMRRDIEQLHDPVGISYEEAMVILRAKMKADRENNQ